MQTTYLFYEQTTDGWFNEYPHIYTKEKDDNTFTEIDKDIIFEAIEIEGLDNSRVLLVTIDINQCTNEIIKRKIIFDSNIVRTNSPSEYVYYNSNKLIPTIYKIDRKRSSIEYKLFETYVYNDNVVENNVDIDELEDE